MSYFVGKNKTFLMISLFCFLMFFSIKASNIFDMSYLLNRPSCSKRFEAIFKGKKSESKKSFVSNPVFLAVSGGIIFSAGVIILWFYKNCKSQASGKPESGAVAENKPKEKVSESVSSVQMPAVKHNFGSVAAKRKLFEDAIRKAQAKDTIMKNYKFNSSEKVEKIIDGLSGCSVDEMKKHIDEGFDVNSQGHRGWTALHRVCFFGNPDVVKLLIESGADIEKIDENGDSAIHIASSVINLKAIKLLVDAGAEIDKSGRDGLTPLLNVIRKTCWDYQGDSINIIKFFIENGADINKGDNFGEALIHFVSKYRNEPVIEFLVNNGANVNLKTRNNMTPLHYYFIGRKGIRYSSHSLNFLIEHGAVVDQPDNEGRTPLHLCAMAEPEWNLRINDLRTLLNNDANIEKKDINGRTPLYYALLHDNFEGVKYLVKRGANVNQSDINGKSCLDLAKEKCDKDFLKLVFHIEDKELSKEVCSTELFPDEEIPDDNCSICLDSLRCKAGENCNGEVCQIECGHFFHKNCINAWFLENETCPNCRAKQEKRFY